jgi:hypothetical protein
MQTERVLGTLIIAICLTATTHRQKNSSLMLRFHVAFPFTVEKQMFVAGEYEVTRPTQFILALRNMENQASTFEHVRSAGSSKEVNGHAKVVFHRYGGPCGDWVVTG